MHDKYERLAAEEGQLAASRTSYFAAIGTVLVTGLVVIVANLVSHPELLALMVSFLSGLGVLISVVWMVILHRTSDAQSLWRQAALQLESTAAPLAARVPSTIHLRRGTPLPIDLALPYHAHAERFSAGGKVSWMDRVDPARMTEVLPQAFVVIWAAALVSTWVWFGLMA